MTLGALLDSPSYFPQIFPILEICSQICHFINKYES